MAEISNIKSKFILEKIVKLIPKIKLLNILRYNKILQKRLNKDISAYKNEYLKIEIEIIPTKNGNGKFINLDNESNPYYQIYFNDNNE